MIDTIISKLEELIATTDAQAMEYKKAMDYYIKHPEHKDIYNTCKNAYYEKVAVSMAYYRAIDIVKEEREG